MTGSVASMGLALAVGRGDSQLARLAGPVPLVRGGDVALIGRRDEGQSYGHDALAVSGILDVPWAAISPDGETILATALADTASTVLDRVAASDASGFWVLVDADVLNPEVMPAIGSPEPGGPDIDELAALIAPLAAHPKALGMALTLYDPSLDPDRSSAARLVELLAKSLLVGDGMPRRLDIVGAPSSAGAYAPGQERAPQAYRSTGLPALLQERGIAVNDRGDVPGFRWRIDPEHMRAMNADAAAGVARAVAEQVAAGLSDGSAMLVLGGDCTVELGTVAGASRETPDVGLVYIDYDTDMNTPLSVEDGALDWMGVAHLLGLPDTVPSLAGVGHGCRCCARIRSSCSRTAARPTSSAGRSMSSASRRYRWRRYRRTRRALRAASSTAGRGASSASSSTSTRTFWIFSTSRSPRRHVGTEDSVSSSSWPHFANSSPRRTGPRSRSARLTPTTTRTARPCGG